MHARIVECAYCGQIYSNPYFSQEQLARLYTAAAYIEEEQLANMAADYFREFQRAVGAGSHPGLRILDIGCGNGFFLDRLRRAGYIDLWGVEPGRAAVERAPPALRDRILCDFFRPGLFEAASFDAVCCFQVFDHMLDPNQFLAGVSTLLRPGGLLIAINHNIRAAITRVLAERSPMFDIEHVFLFDKKTIRRFVTKHGFTVMDVRDLWNSYTIEYALKMLPLPSPVRRALSGFARTTGAARLILRVPGGNMVTVARRES